MINGCTFGNPWPEACINVAKTTMEESMAIMEADQGGASIVGQIETLPDPYRGNVIEWLRSCTQSPLDDLEEDIESFLSRLNPKVRDQFILQTNRLLDTAKFYFGTTS